MTLGGGRFAFPSLFPTVDKFFNASLPSKTYTYDELIAAIADPANLNDPALHIITKGDVDNRIAISQYGTFIFSDDHPDRSYLFGLTAFRLITDSLKFTVSGNQRYIEGIRIGSMSSFSVEKRVE
jgi:hypothetical protein